MATEKKQLGQLLLESGLITESQVSDVLTYQREHSLVFGKAVVSCPYCVLSNRTVAAVAALTAPATEHNIHTTIGDETTTNVQV